MTISFVTGGSAIYEADTGAMPSHQAGDLIVVFAFRRSTTVVPTVPAAFGGTTLSSKGLTNRSSVAAALIATSGAHTLGTWTNAEFVAVVVYRDSVNYLAVGKAVHFTASTGTTGTYGGLLDSAGATQRSTNSWVGAFIGLNLNSTDGDLAPAGMTNRQALAGASNGEVAIHDTNATADWPSSVTVTFDASTAHATLVYEIWDTGVAKSAGGGGPLVSGRLVQ